MSLHSDDSEVLAVTLTAIIVDDEPLARDLLVAILSDIDDIEIVAQPANGREAVDAVLNLSPDIMFLDIEMPGMTGLDVVKAVQADIMPAIIFTTAYAQYAVEAFKVRAINYVLKPLDETAIYDSVARVRALVPKSEAPKVRPSKADMLSALTAPLSENAGTVIISDTDTLSVVETQTIDWAEAEGDYVCLHMGGHTRLIRATLKSVQAELPGSQFMRIHRSTLVNLKCVKDVIRGPKGSATLITKTGQSLKVSRTHSAELRSKLL